MLPYTQSFSSLTKPLLRILLNLWSTGEETVRVVAFINILRIATSHKESTLEKLLKVRSTCYKKVTEKHDKKIFTIDSIIDVSLF